MKSSEELYAPVQRAMDAGRCPEAIEMCRQLDAAYSADDRVVLNNAGIYIDAGGELSDAPPSLMFPPIYARSVSHP